MYFAPAVPSLVNFAFSFLLVLNKGLNLLAFWRYLENPICLHILPLIFPWWVSQVCTFYWLFCCLGIVTESKNLFRLTSSLNPPKSAVGEVLGPLFIKSLDLSRWSKNSVVSYNTWQVMWAHLIFKIFCFTALIDRRFNTLHNFNIWSYRGHTSTNNTHNNAAKVA